MNSERSSFGLALVGRALAAGIASSDDLERDERPLGVERLAARPGAARRTSRRHSSARTAASPSGPDAGTPGRRRRSARRSPRRRARRAAPARRSSRHRRRPARRRSSGGLRRAPWRSRASPPPPRRADRSRRRRGRSARPRTGRRRQSRAAHCAPPRRRGRGRRLGRMSERSAAIGLASASSGLPPPNNSAAGLAMNDHVTASRRPSAASARLASRVRFCSGVSTGAGTPSFRRGNGAGGTRSRPAMRTICSTMSALPSTSGRQLGTIALPSSSVEAEPLEDRLAFALRDVDAEQPLHFAIGEIDRAFRLDRIASDDRAATARRRKSR